MKLIAQKIISLTYPDFLKIPVISCTAKRPCLTFKNIGQALTHPRSYFTFCHLTIFYLRIDIGLNHHEIDKFRHRKFIEHIIIDLLSIIFPPCQGTADSTISLCDTALALNDNAF